MKSIGRAVTYNRVSTKKTSQDTSIATQDYDFNQWFAEHPGIELVGSFYDRLSGDESHRPGLDAL